MAALPPKSTSDSQFLGYLEDFVKIVPNELKGLYGLILTSNRKILLGQLEQQAATVPPEQVTSATVEGEVSELKGVTVQVDLQKLIADPITTLKAIGIKTLQEIAYVEEIGETRASDYVEKALKGTLTGPDLMPDSLILKAADPLFEFSKLSPTGTGKDMQLLKKITVNGKERWVDRSIAEGDRPTDADIKPYVDLAANLIQMTTKMDRTPTRRLYHTQSLNAANRAVAEALGFDLDKILDTKQKVGLVGKQKPNIGRLHNAIAAAGGDVKNLLTVSSNQTQAQVNANIAYIIKGSPSAMVDPLELEFAKRWITEEYYKMKTDPALPWRTGQMMTELWQKEGFTADLDGQIYYAPTPQRAIINPIKGPMVTEDAANKIYDEVVQTQRFVTNRRKEIAKKSRELAQARLQANFRLQQELMNEATRKAASEGVTDPAAVAVLQQEALKIYVNKFAERFYASQNVADYQKHLFIVSTVREIFSTAEAKTLFKNFVVASRLLNLMPGTKLRAWQEYVTFLNYQKHPIFQKNALGINFTQNALVKSADALLQGDPAKFAMMVGLHSLHFEAPGMDQVPTLAKIPARLGLFKGKVGIDFALNAPTPLAKAPVNGILGFFKHIPIINQIPVSAGFAFVDRTKGLGIFGENFPMYQIDNQFGVFNVLRTIDEYNLLNQLRPLGFASKSAEDLLLHLGPTTGHLNEFYINTINACNKVAAKQALTAAEGSYSYIGWKLGLLDKTGNLIDKNFTSFTEHFTAFTKAGQGRDLLQGLKGLGLDPSRRWKFLQDLHTTGKSAQFGHEFVGLLQTYQRYAQQAQDFFYKNVIFNPGLVNTPVIGPALGAGQRFIRRLGFSDDLSIYHAVASWYTIRKLQLYGKVMDYYLRTGRIPGLLKGSQLGAFIRAYGATSGGKAILRILAYTLGTSSVWVSAGISVAVIWLTDIGWKIVKGFLTLKPIEGYKQALKSAKSKIETLNRILFYPINLIIMSCTGCVLFVIVAFVIITGATFAEFNTATEVTEDPRLSENIQVTKTAELKAGDRTIKYTIVIRNISQQTVTIASIEDRLTFTYPCEGEGDNSGKTIKLGDDGFPGQVDGGLPTVDGIEIPAGQQITLEFTLSNIIEEGKDGTYFNFIEATVAADNKLGRATVSTIIGEGGCTLATCPGGWPIDAPFGVAQGPNGAYSHRNVQAMDAGNGRQGDPIYATHDGIVRINRYGNDASTCARGGSSAGEGYGCHVVLEDINDQYITIYAHMWADPNNFIEDGKQVTRGEKIGEMGTTGFSSGVHIHYEMRDIDGTKHEPNYECIQGFPLGMQNVQDIQYVPETIPRGCSGNCPRITQ